MALSSKWIRTLSGHAGRYGYITRCPKGEATKFKFTSYQNDLIHYGDSVNELKKIADEYVVSIEVMG